MNNSQPPVKTFLKYFSKQLENTQINLNPRSAENPSAARKVRIIDTPQILSIEFSKILGALLLKNLGRVFLLPERHSVHSQEHRRNLCEMD